MSLEDLTLDQARDLLSSWSNTLSAKVDSHRDEIIETLDPRTLPGMGAFSRSAAALLAVRQIDNALEEVIGAVDLVKQAIRKTDAGQTSQED
jgi:hypothetical protein